MKRILVGMILAALVFAASWELLQPGMIKTHDYVHGARIAEMGRALQDGHFPVRWSQNLGYGYGMPLFEFYAPLPYYLGALFWLFGFSLPVSVQLLFWLATLGTAIAAYLLGKSLFGRLGGLMTAAAITLAPYRAVNLFIRGALGEAWGMMAGVMVLYGSVLILKRQKHGLWILLLSLCTLFLSHNLMTLIFVPFALLFVLLWLGFKWMWVNANQVSQNNSSHLRKIMLEDVKEYLPKFSTAYVLAGALSAFYLLPAFTEKHYTMVEKLIISGYFDFHLHFIYLRQLFTPYWGYGGSVWGPEDGISFFLGWGQLVGIFITGLLTARLFWHQRQLRQKFLWQHGLLWTACLLFAMSILLATEKTLFAWEGTELLRYVQFPWRFLAVTAVFSGLMIGYATRLVKSFPSRLLVAGVLILLILGNFRYFKAESLLDNPEELYYADELKIQKQMSGILPDFMPKDFKLIDQAPTQPFKCDPECNLDEGERLVDKVLVNRTHQKLIELAQTDDSQISFSVAYFPGWVAEVDGERVPTTIDKDGLIQVLVPAGEHLVGINFASTPIRWWADVISAVALLVVLTFFYHQRQQRD